MTDTASRDPNYVTTIMGVDLSTGRIPTNVYVDETTHRLLVNAVINNRELVAGIDYDYLSVVATNSTTDTLTYRNGGVAGTVVQELVVTYAGSGVEKISDSFSVLTWS